MIKLVRGGVILSLIGMFVAVLYAHTETENVLSIATDSQVKLDSSFIESNLVTEIKPVETEIGEVQDPVNKGQEVNNKQVAEDKQVEQDKNKQGTSNKVVKTVSTRATAAGMSRGKFTATAYCLKGRTAMGHGVRKGLIAADPRVLPLGSRISIDGGYAGTYLVSDTGGRIKGNKLDIWMASCSEARRFGRRNVSVMYLGR